MNAKAEQVVTELQAVLTRHRAALFFSPDNEGELWIEGSCAGHVTHGDNCELIEGSVCESAEQCATYSVTVQEAFRAWTEHRVYVDSGRNYRLRPEPATPTHRPRGKIAPWNKEVKRLFPSCAEFHQAATKFFAEQRAKEL